jgi:hypothetical protein
VGSANAVLVEIAISSFRELMTTMKIGYMYTAEMTEKMMVNRKFKSNFVLVIMPVPP